MGVDGLSRSDSNRSTLPEHGNSPFHHHRTGRPRRANSSNGRGRAALMQPRTSPRHKALASPVCAQSRKTRPETSNRFAKGAHHRHETMPVLRQHQEHPHPPKRSIAGAATHPDSRAATVAPHGTPAFEYQSGPETRAVRPTRRHRSAPPETGRAARGKASRSKPPTGRPPASGETPLCGVEAPVVHPIGGYFAPKKKSRRRSASRPKRCAPPGAGQGVDGLSRSVSNRQRPQSRIPLPITTAALRGRHARVAKLQHAKARLPMPKSRSMPIINP